MPFFSRDLTCEGEAGLRDAVEEQLDGTVPKSDVREAAMLVAQENEDFVAVPSSLSRYAGRSTV